MHIKLKCSACGDSMDVAFAQLYKIWKDGYEQMSEEKKGKARATTRIKCHCGTKDSYNSPMFSYVFQLIFTELIKNRSI